MAHPDYRHRLASFRSAARQVRSASIVALGENIGLEFREDAPNVVGVYIKLLDDERFRSLAVAIRLAYLQGEPAHFEAVCNVLHVRGGDEIKARTAVVRERWQAAIRNQDLTTVIGEDPAEVSFTVAEVFEHGLNGVAFHQDAGRQEAIRHLESIGANFVWAVQGTALLLAQAILDLDDVVADFLGEPQLERLN